jgi:hypothetical protein
MPALSWSEPCGSRVFGPTRWTRWSRTSGRGSRGGSSRSCPAAGCGAAANACSSGTSTRRAASDAFGAARGARHGTASDTRCGTAADAWHRNAVGEPAGCAKSAERHGATARRTTVDDGAATATDDAQRQPASAPAAAAVTAADLNQKIRR